MVRTRIKVCCMASADEARLAVAHAASAVGLVSAMPSGPGAIAEERIAEIAAAVPPGVATVLLTSSVSVAEIVAQQRRCGVNTIQLVDRVPVESVTQLRQALPGVKIIQVVHVVDGSALAEARAAAAVAHALLLDSGNPGLAVKELGGTGRVHDWEISREIRDAVSVPVFLAGGLNPDNVAAAISRVRPFGVDVCTGVRTDGLLDERKLRSFVSAAEMAGREGG